MVSKRRQTSASGRSCQFPAASATQRSKKQPGNSLSLGCNPLGRQRWRPSTASQAVGTKLDIRNESFRHPGGRRFAHRQHQPSRSMLESLRLAAVDAFSLIHSSRNIFPILAFSLLCTLGACEDAAVNDNDDGEGIHDNEIFPEGATTEWYMVLAFSLMFGFFITLFGAMIAYFSFMEDVLMRHYIREGELIRADVMSAEFARGGGRVGVCSRARESAEYICFVEYTHKLSTNYSVRVRKQIKAKETDFIRPVLAGSKAMLMSIKVQVGGDDMVQEDGGSDDAYYESHDDHGAVNPSGTYPAADTIELYVLPDCPKSGHPRRQVERSCSYRYRLLTAALIAFDIALAVFCTRLAAEAIVDLEDIGQRRIGWYAIAIFSALVVLEVPLIHCFMRGFFLDALREEYLESGEFVPLERDDSSMSSAGSDVFLSMTRCVSPIGESTSVSQ